MAVSEEPAHATTPVLPEPYAADLKQAHLAPLWSIIRSLIPRDLPQRKTSPALWRYVDVRRLLMQSGELVPIELAERRALVLCNPGLGAERLRATPSIFIGLQLLLPGETAANHRHTASALRLVVEGRGGYTTVDGQRLPMDPGDLVLTPAGCWHEHGQEGAEPVVWLDALDVPLVHDLEASVSEGGEQQSAAAALDASATRFQRAGLIPYKEIGSRESYPLLRFPWLDVRAALLALSRGLPREAAVHLAYVNPLTGAECLPTLGCSALLLRPGEQRRFPRRSASAVVHSIEGECDALIDDESLSCAERDVLAIPTHANWSIANRSATQPAFLFMVDDAPLQRKMRIYREFA